MCTLPEGPAAVRRIGATLGPGPGAVAAQLWQRASAGEVPWPHVDGSLHELDAQTELSALFTVVRGIAHERVRSFGKALAVHDSATLQFEGAPRQGLFETSPGREGFIAHVCLGVSADEARAPLGMLGVLPVVRGYASREEAQPGVMYANEAARWSDLLALVDDERPPGTQLLHVFGREGDSFGLLELLHVLEADYVLRVAQDRRVATPEGTTRLSRLRPERTLRVSRTVPARPRRGSVGGSPVAPPERVAPLELAACRADLLRPGRSSSRVQRLPVHVLKVREMGAARRRGAIDWTLVTGQPLSDRDAMLGVLDAFRARWSIAGWFRVVREHLAFERSQLPDLEGLLRGFGLTAAVADELIHAQGWAPARI